MFREGVKDFQAVFDANGLPNRVFQADGLTQVLEFRQLWMGDSWLLTCVVAMPSS